MTIRLGIIGWPLTKTFSPNIHQSLSEISNIDIAYKKLPIENFTLDIYESLNSEFDGYNVTIPHKEIVYSPTFCLQLWVFSLWSGSAAGASHWPA